MRRLMRLATRLYPAPWRERYGQEFEALLDDLDASWRDVLNVLMGGLAMRIMSISLVPVGLALVGVLAGAAISLATPGLYQSSGRLRLTANDSTSVRRMLNSTFGPGSHSGVGVEHANRIRIAVDKRAPKSQDGSTILFISTSDEDATKAQRVAQQLIGVVAKAVSTQVASTVPIQLETITAPTLAMSRSGHPAVFAATGGVVGLFLGGVLAWFRQRSEPEGC
jgi:hypothetical protein